jgi:hypothetical protein
MMETNVKPTSRMGLGTYMKVWKLIIICPINCSQQKNLPRRTTWLTADCVSLKIRANSVWVILSLSVLMIYPSLYII